MTQKSIRLGNHQIDLQRLCLQGPEGEIKLRRKSFDVLRCLAERSGEVVSKEDLMQTVWPEVVVGDDSLTQCVSEIRRALGEGGRNIVKTFPRRGYMLEVAASVDQDTRSNPHAAATQPRLQLPDRPSIAVLPFSYLGADAQQQYFADGIAQDITTEVSRFSELLVISPNSSFRYRGATVDVCQIGRVLGAQYVLEGNVRRSAGRVRIAVQLVDAATRVQRWSERYDRELADVFSVQDDVARAIATTLVARVKQNEVRRTLLKPPATWQAYDYYIRAADTYATYLSVLSVDALYETRRLLERSVSMDPYYARAYATLSNTFTTAWLQPLDGDFLNSTALDKAEKYARKAVQLDPTLPQARAQFGMVLTWRRRHDASISEFETAMALNPNFSDWRLFAMALVSAGQPERAIALTRSRMPLDPFYPPFASAWLGLAHYMLKQYREALPPLLECVSRGPNFRHGHVCLAIAHAQLKQLKEAQAAVAEVLRIEPTYTIEHTQRPLSFFRRQEDSDHFFDGLRKAGFPSVRQSEMDGVS